MNHFHAHAEMHNPLARKTSSAVIAFAVVNAAIIALLTGCDSSDAASISAGQRPAEASQAASAEPVTAHYLPQRHAIAANAAEGNVTTYERD